MELEVKACGMWKDLIYLKICLGGKLFSMYWDLIGEVGTYDEEHAPILIFYYIDYIYIKI